MSKNKRGWQIVAVIVVLCCILFVKIAWPSHALELSLNWGLNLPLFSFCSEVYGDNSEIGFFGDGIEYHVFSYERGSFVEGMVPWSYQSGATRYTESYESAIQCWLEEIDVPSEWFPDYGGAAFWYCLGDDDLSEIIVVWNKTCARLYVVENKI